MLSKAHIVYVCFFLFRIGKLNGIVVETEALCRLVALCNGKERLSVVTFNSRYKIILAVKINRTRVQHSVYAKTLHKIGVCLGVHIILPEVRSMISCQNRVHISVIYAVIAIVNGVLSVDKTLIIVYHSLLVIFK